MRGWSEGRKRVGGSARRGPFWWPPQSSTRRSFLFINRPRSLSGRRETVGDSQWIVGHCFYRFCSAMCSLWLGKELEGMAGINTVFRHVLPLGHDIPATQTHCYSLVWPARNWNSITCDILIQLFPLAAAPVSVRAVKGENANGRSCCCIHPFDMGKQAGMSMLPPSVSPYASFNHLLYISLLCLTSSTQWNRWNRTLQEWSAGPAIDTDPSPEDFVDISKPNFYFSGTWVCPTVCGLIRWLKLPPYRQGHWLRKCFCPEISTSAPTGDCLLSATCNQIFIPVN